MVTPEIFSCQNTFKLNITQKVFSLNGSFETGNMKDLAYGGIEGHVHIFSHLSK